MSYLCLPRIATLRWLIGAVDGVDFAYRRFHFGLWQNFGGTRPIETSARSSAAHSIWVLPTSIWPTTTVRRTARPRRLAPYRDGLVISTKAGYDMWPGPYGEWGSRKYLLASLDQSLKRLRPCRKESGAPSAQTRT